MEYLFNSNFDDDFQMPLIFEWEIFEEQYQNLLYDYLKSFPNATEHNFKQEYKKKYKFLIKQKNNELIFKETFLIEIETPTELISKKVSKEDLLLILSNPIRNYLNSLSDKYYDINCTLNLIANTKNFLIFNLFNGVKINYLGKKCNIGYNVLIFLFEIIIVSYDRYYIDENRYNILKYDILKIYEFLSNKIENNLNNTYSKNSTIKEFKWHTLIKYFVNGELMNLYNEDKNSATNMANKIIEKHSLEIKTEDIRPYLQQTFFNGKTDFDAELPKNLFTEKKLIEIWKYCKEKKIKITDSKVLDKISDFGVDIN